MPGFGSQPCGSSPYGIGTPAVAPATGGALLRDPYTGVSQGSRKIDSVTRDYVLDANGRILGMGNVQQLVLLAVSTTKGSSAMRQLGQEIQKVKRVSSNFTARVQNLVVAAVQPLVDRRLISVIGMTADIVSPGIIRYRLQWRDLTTQNDEVTEL